MPAAYAHLTFGRTIRNQLDHHEITSLIEQYTDLFEIGLQGPDILFFYQPLRHHRVNRIGYALHKQPASCFFSQPAVSSCSDAGLAYLLGFICHYALDRQCHSYVQYFMDRTQRGHSELETDFERYLMHRHGLDPMKHTPSAYVQDNADNAAVIAPFFGVTAREVKVALSTMKFVGKFLTPRNPVKHRLLLCGARMLGEHHIVRELMISPTEETAFQQSNSILAQEMERAVPAALALMENFYAHKQGREPLSSGFAHTFDADEAELIKIKERFDVL